MPALFDSGYSETLAGASHEGAQITHPTPISGGYLFLEIAIAAITFKMQCRFYNGREWMKYHDLVDDELTTNQDPSAAIVSGEYTLKNQDFWKEPIYGVQVKYVRLTGAVDAVATKGNARLIV